MRERPCDISFEGMSDGMVEFTIVYLCWGVLIIQVIDIGVH